MARKNNSRNANEASWFYEGRTKNGDLVTGTIEAETAIIARVKLRKRDIIPFSVKQRSNLSFLNDILAQFKFKASTQEKKLSLFAKLARSKEIHALTNKDSTTDKKKKKVKKPVKDKEITVFIKQFVVVVKSGVPLLKAFDIVIRGQENKKFYEILEDIKFGVENGLSLSESFGTYPMVFDPLFINFLSIGEQGGILETLLTRYIEYKEKIDAVKRRVKSAMVYPVIVVIVCTLVLGVVLGFVVPQFQKIFENMNATLPAPTLVVIAISHAITRFWWLIIAAIAGAVFAFKSFYRGVPRFRFFVDSTVFKIPLFGELAQKTLISRWTRTLSLLFAAGVPLNDALRSIALLVDNYLYGAATLNIQKDVESGSSLYNAMLTTDIFPNMVNQMVAVGEEAGSLDFLLQSIADYYDQEIEMVIEALLSLIEPATIVVLGGILGSIIVAIYLPLFHLGDVVG
ncbi:MAG: type II secretion system F family protein [Burkholderiales bacterium]|nr:type II secretion system F family protein [Burkholderiales bacterium]